MSQLAVPFENAADSELALHRKADGYITISGTNNGYTQVLQIDLLKNVVIDWAYYKKFEGSACSHRRRGDIRYRAVQEIRDLHSYVGRTSDALV